VGKKIFKDLSANALQTGVSQLAGLLIFYFMSRFIPKSDFGEYSWATAVGSTIVAIGSLGLDFVLVKRIAAGQDARLMAGLHFFHTLFVGLLTILLLFVVQFCWPHFLDYHPLFLLVVIQLVLSSFANSIKFSLTGLEQFKALATVSVIINGLKLMAVVFLYLFKTFTIQNIVIGFVGTSFIELLINYYFINKKISPQFKPILEKKAYKDFVLESLPQLGVVLFDSALARVDWILLGIFSTATITAEYSFAYKFFELSKLPLLILAPVLLTRFSKLFHSNEPITAEKQKAIQDFFNLEIFISLLIPIFMICAWTDLIDLITDGKYGAVNQLIFTILAICVPLHFVINYLWTIGFVQGKLKEIMWITITVSILNLVSNIILIPLYGSVGAAVSFLLVTTIQLLFYFLFIKQNKLGVRFVPTMLFFLYAFLSILIAQLLFSNNYFAAIGSCIFYLSFVLLTKSVRLSKISY
jgi:O-antigen/teichoic acid export membrane protein